MCMRVCVLSVCVCGHVCASTCVCNVVVVVAVCILARLKGVKVIVQQGTRCGCQLATPARGDQQQPEAGGGHCEREPVLAQPLPRCLCHLNVSCEQSKRRQTNGIVCETPRSSCRCTHTDTHTYSVHIYIHTHICICLYTQTHTHAHKGTHNRKIRNQSSVPPEVASSTAASLSLSLSTHSPVAAPFSLPFYMFPPYSSPLPIPSFTSVAFVLTSLLVSRLLLDQPDANTDAGSGT